MPSTRSLEARVFGLTPMSSAAPPAPETLPPACFNTLRKIRALLFPPLGFRVELRLIDGFGGGFVPAPYCKIKLQWSTLGENHSPLNHVLQLPYVSGPVIALQPVHLPPGNFHLRHVQPRTRLHYKV